MRSLLALAVLLAVACTGGDRAESPAAVDSQRPAQPSGPAPLLLRVPRGGGAARVVAYPQVDSVVWRSSEALPALDRVIAFGDDEGMLAFVDQRGRVGRLDMRQGGVAIASRERMSEPASINGADVYGVTGEGKVERLSPEGNWTLEPPRPARMVWPQYDGTLVVFGGRGSDATLWLYHPPNPEPRDSVAVPAVGRALRTGAFHTDRAYFTTEEGLAAVQTRTLDRSIVELEAPAAAIAVTPSGDRLYVVDSSRTLRVIDRYRNRVVRDVELPGAARDLRVDALGRFLLVRPLRGDSAWVIAIGTTAIVGTVRTAWRGDLPFVAPDGAIATVMDGDVVFVAPNGGAGEQGRVAGGASDFWYPFWWSGFRPRAASLDEPVRFDTLPLPIDSAAPPPPDTTVRTDTVVAARGFIVSFAAFLSEQRAHEMAARVIVGGQQARVVVAAQGATPIYRVVIGPFATREEAERVGRESGQSYVVYEDRP